MSVVIQLMDERSLGRNFQIATLGCILENASPTLKSAILNGLSTGFITLNQKDCGELLALISNHLDLIGKDRPVGLYPKLYTAGAKDFEILKKAGLVKSNKLVLEELKETSLNLDCGKLTDEVSTPMFLRQYVFSKYRTGGEVGKISVGSLWLALIGAITSLAAALNINDQRTEIYIVPGGTKYSMISSSTFYNLMYSENVKRRFDLVIRDLTRRELSGVSADQALNLAIMIHAAQDLSLTMKLVNGKVFEEFLIVKTIAEQRPQLIYATPLTLSRHFEFLSSKLGSQRMSSLLLNTYELALRSSPQKGLSEGIRNTGITASTSCLNGLFRYFETRDESSLVECAGDTARLYQVCLENGVKDLAENARWILTHLSKL